MVSCRTRNGDNSQTTLSYRFILADICGLNIRDARCQEIRVGH